MAIYYSNGKLDILQLFATTFSPELLKGRILGSRTFSTQNYDPRHYLSFRRSAQSYNKCTHGRSNSNRWEEGGIFGKLVRAVVLITGFCFYILNKGMSIVPQLYLVQISVHRNLIVRFL
jgi:hypothetical protein